MLQHWKKVGLVHRHNKLLLLLLVRCRGALCNRHQQQKEQQQQHPQVPAGILLLWEGWLAE
jgi:hypothetical protein